jgi:hypothetical protein
MDFAQLVIVLLGGLAIFLTLRGHKKLGLVVLGIISQLWIWALRRMLLDKPLPGVFVLYGFTERFQNTELREKTSESSKKSIYI